METLIDIGLVISIISSVLALLITYIQHGKTKAQLKSVKNYRSMFEAQAKILESLENIENAVVQTGSLLVIKTLIEGEEKVTVIEMTDEQKKYLSEHESLMRDPTRLYHYFSPPPKFGGYIEHMRGDDKKPNKKSQPDA